MSNELSRRSFVTGATAAVALGAAAMAPAVCAMADEAGRTWEAEADIVIVGGGNAGFAALTTVYCEGLGSALLLEAAPEEQMGGNSRVSGQGVFCPKSVEAAIDYQNKCNGAYKVSDELMQAWAENICENVEWMEENVGFEAQEKGGAEFPEYDETGDIVWYAHQGMGPWEHTWKLLVDAAAEYDAPVYCDARAIRLVKDASGTICGVECADGRSFKANKGVILACGGFEANQEMMDNYMEIGFPGYRNQGTPWNRGDGIKMAMSAGCDLWHMNNVSGNTLQIRSDLDNEQATTKFTLKADDYIYMTADGYRFVNEKSTARHGKVYRAGTWAGAIMPEVSYLVMGEESFQTLACGGSGWYGRVEADAQLKTGLELLDAGLVTKCETVADLAAALGASEEHVAASLDLYNGYAESGIDLDFHREMPFDDDNPAFANTGDNEGKEAIALVAVNAPYYVTRMYGSILNTQGGPRRGVGGEVLDVEGNPIPRLYAAGEMGCIYGYAYNLGGNFSEAISSGRLAARTCSALPAVEA